MKILCPNWTKGKAKQRGISVESRGRALSFTWQGVGGGTGQEMHPRTLLPGLSLDSKLGRYGLGFSGSLSSGQYMRP